MSNFWTPFCSKKTGIEHAIVFGQDAACAYCGQANPSPSDFSERIEPIPVIEVPDTPPARKSTNSESCSSDQSRFSMLNTASNIARQDSITRSRTQDRPHAGTKTLSSRLKSDIKGGQASVATKQFHLQIHIYAGDLLDKDFRIYTNWRLLNKTVSHVSNKDVYDTMDDLLHIITRDVKIYPKLTSTEFFVETFLASHMDLKTGPVCIPDRVIETTMESLLSQYFTSHGAASPIWTIYLCIGLLSEEDQEIVSEAEKLKTTKKKKATKVKTKKKSSVKVEKKIDLKQPLSSSMPRKRSHSELTTVSGNEVKEEVQDEEHEELMQSLNNLDPPAGRTRSQVRDRGQARGN